MFTVLAIVIAAFAASAWLFIAASRGAKVRSSALEALAPQLGLSCISVREPDHCRFGTPLFSRGTGRAISNAMQGKVDGLGVVLFDYSYNVGSGDDIRAVFQTVAAFADSRGTLPTFFLEKKNVMSRLEFKKFHLPNKVHLDKSSEFDERFLLSGTDAAAVTMLFTPVLLGFLLSSNIEKKFNVEGAGQWLVIYCTGSVSPESWKSFLQETSAFAREFYQNCGFGHALRPGECPPSIPTDIASMSSKQ